MNKTNFYNHTDEEIDIFKRILDDILLDINNGSNAYALIESKSHKAACIVDLSFFTKAMIAFTDKED